MQPFWHEPLLRHIVHAIAYTLPPLPPQIEKETEEEIAHKLGRLLARAPSWLQWALLFLTPLFALWLALALLWARCVSLTPAAAISCALARLEQWGGKAAQAARLFRSLVSFLYFDHAAVQAHLGYEDAGTRQQKHRAIREKLMQAAQDDQAQPKVLSP